MPQLRPTWEERPLNAPDSLPGRPRLSPEAARTSRRGRSLRSALSTKILAFLTVKDAPRAIEFYEQAFGANELSRLDAPGGRIVAELEIDGAPVNVTDENPEGHNLSPETLGGTSVRIDLIVDDPDAVAQRAIEAGASELFPVADQPYGWRQGRVVDPFGHHWLIGRPLS